MKIRRIITAKLARFGESEAIDRDFWRQMGPEGRFSAAWEMVAEADLMCGGTGNVPRLRRDVARLVRLKDADNFLTTTKLFLGKQ
jgi:hypothetical protein